MVLRAMQPNCGSVVIIGDFTYRLGHKAHNSYAGISNRRRHNWNHPITGRGAVLDFDLVTRTSRLSFLDLRACREAGANFDQCLVATILRLEDDGATKRRKYKKQLKV
ncbi:hypothetical protein ACTXT7_016163 [Hymenolepis weldensis]